MKLNVIISRASLVTTCALIAAAVALVPNASLAANPPHVDQDGTIHVPAFLLPESSLLHGGTSAALKRARDSQGTGGALKGCLSADGADLAAMPAIRQCQANAFRQTAFYKELIEQYPVVMTSQEIGGVYTEVFTPKDGISPENNDRVLINMHGGHFKSGSRTNSHVESIPIAALGKIKVISIDYRMAPEHTFPAASEDVAAVYRELLKSYKPQNIGLYGSSAGGLLTAESIAWFDKHALPLPGAVGMFCGAAGYYQEGDSARVASALEGFPLEPPSVHPYFKGTDAANPLAFPIHSPELMAKFPPSLLIATTRDVALSSVAYTHGQLLRSGIQAELRVWEGLGHVFYSDPGLPESREVYDVIVEFFQRHLGKPPKAHNVAPEASVGRR
jgi:acetyl esterase/lipase